MKKYTQTLFFFLLTILGLQAQNPFEITIIAQDKDCQGAATAQARVYANGGQTPYSYLWSTGAITPTVTLPAGTYFVTVTEATGQTLVDSVTIVANPDGFEIMIAASATQICLGEEVSLTAESAFPASYTWQPGNQGTAAIQVSPSDNTTYTVTGESLGGNLVDNGDFEINDLNTFFTDYDPPQGGSNGPLTQEGTLGIASSPNDLHENFADCSDHTLGFGNMLVVNGADQPNQAVWCQTVEVEPTTTYQFSTWVTSAISQNPAELQFSINGNLLGPVLSPTAPNCTWQQFFTIWNSNANTQATICIVNQNNLDAGNDFALDDISLRPVCTATDEVLVEVSDLQATAEALEAESCLGNLGSAQVNISGGVEPITILWDNGETDAVAVSLSAGPHTVTVTDAFDCEAVAEVAVDLIEGPMIEEVFVQEIACDAAVTDSVSLLPGSIGLQAIPGDNGGLIYSSDGGNMFMPDTLFSNLSPGDYLLVVEDELGCRDSAQATLEAPMIPTLSLSTTDTIACADQPATITADASANVSSFQWSTGDTGEEIIVTEQGVYELLVLTDDDCPATDSIRIAPCPQYLMPTVFTPNGDGNNDLFGPVTVGPVQVKSFQVFNRWGDLVHDNINPWPGEQDGSPAPQDVYAYLIVVELEDGEEEKAQGEVTLVR